MPDLPERSAARRRRRTRDVVDNRSSCGTLPGYACVVSKQHVVEPFELSPAAQGAFFRDAMQVARTLSELFKPIKMNYQINGNTLPHLHMHLYPRLTDDPFVGAPIDGSAAGFLRTARELDAIKRALSPSSGTEES